MIAFQVGSNAADGANMLQEAIDSAEGHNAGTDNSRITIENNAKGVLTLIQTEVGPNGNTDITVTDDGGNKVDIANGKFTGGNKGLTELSRLLIKFEYDKLTPRLTKDLDLDDPSFKSFLYFRDVTTGRATPSNVKLLAMPLSKSFSEGIGRSVSTFNDLDCANFITASFSPNSSIITTWAAEGANLTGTATHNAGTNLDAISILTSSNSTPFANPTGTDLRSYFSLVDGNEDVVFDVTRAISSSLKNDIANHGFRVSFDESIENDSTFFIVVGKSGRIPSVYVIKTDDKGDKQWENIYGAGPGGKAQYIIETEEQTPKYILVGQDNHLDTPDSDLIIAGINTNGESPWFRSIQYGNSINEIGNFITRLSNGGYVVVGSKQNESWDDLLVMKANSDGTPAESWLYGGNYNEAGSYVQESQSGFIFSGSTESFGQGLYDMWVVSTDINGNEIYSQTFGGDMDDKALGGAKGDNEEPLIIGYTSSFGNGGEDILFIKIDPDYHP